jgi:alpha-beta hydrolase superfamily lysophospholipase
MSGTPLSFNTKDNEKGYALQWIPKGEIKGLLIINHGMAEHIARYNDFALFMNEQGFAVYGEDHRGHGQRVGESEQIGYFATQDGWLKVLSDIGCLVDLVKKEYPGVPLFMLGHSMGSFLTRDYMCSRGNELSGVILSGTGYTGALIIKIFKFLARYEIRTYGDRHVSTMLEKLSIGSFNKNFEPARTPFDWLSRDQEQVDLYAADPLCGFTCTSSFYADLALGLGRIIDRTHLAGTPKDLPLFFYSGDQDPVGGKLGRDVKKVADLYRSLGSSSVEVELNPGGRHESLNELDRENVYNRFYRFIEQNLPDSEKK